MRSQFASDWHLRGVNGTREVPENVRVMLTGGFELFATASSGLAKLSVDTSNDLFEMDPRVSVDAVYDFRSKRSEWLKLFGSSLREFFERRMAGQRRQWRRPDSKQSLSSLRVMTDSDTHKQTALSAATRRLIVASKGQLEELDCRVSALLASRLGEELDNPFSPAYLLDAIGMASRTVYPDQHIWRSLMERVVSDFTPAVNNVYIQLNRFLADRGVLPDIGATLRARSGLRPDDDRQLLPLYSRLLNEVEPALQPWRTLDGDAAKVVGFRLEALAVNPYALAGSEPPRQARSQAGDFPRLDAMMAHGSLSPVLETLDAWQRNDPLTEHVRVAAPVGIDAGVMPINRIPWIHAAMASRISVGEARTTMDVVALLFDYIFRDTSLSPRFRMAFDGMQLPVLKAALADPSFFVDREHPVRRLIDMLAEAAVGATDGEDYGKGLRELVDGIVKRIRTEFVLDTKVFDRACRDLEKFTAEWQVKGGLAIQPHIEAALADEASDDDRAQVRMLIRNKLGGVDIPFDVRAFLGTIWSDRLAQSRKNDGPASDAYKAAVKTMEDLLWSIAAKGQRARLSKMIPPLVAELRAGGARVQASAEKMKRFLDVLYDVHIAAVRPDAKSAAPGELPSMKPALLLDRKIVNLHDFIADCVVGTWFAFDDEVGTHARLSWISPLRTLYILSDRAGATIKVLTPEHLAWEVSTGKASVLLEPVPLVDRAVSSTLEYLDRHKRKPNAAKGEAAPAASASAPAAAASAPNSAAAI